MIKITFLGTAAMQPTKERNLVSILINYNSENILIDCGEGTQRQFKIAGLKPTKLTKILISHWHGDHVLGLGGLIQYLYANDYNKTLEIYGPKGIHGYFSNILKSAIFRHDFKIKLFELKEGTFFKSKDFNLEAVKLNHNTPCFGFALIENPKIKINLEYLKKFGLKKHPLLGELQRGKDIIWKGKKITVKEGTILKKGKKISAILDTAYVNNCIKLAKDSDLLICEATFTNEHKDKAKEYKHLTSEQAAIIAKKAKVKKLALTHFSQRYKNINELKNEAKKIFKNVICSEDFMELQI